MRDGQVGETSSSFEASALAALGQAIVVNDLKRRILYWNKAAEEMFGWTAAEVIGRDVVEVARAEEEGERDALVMSRIMKGEKVTAHYWMMHRDGRRFPVLSTITPVLQDGELVGIASVATDLTERMRADEAMRRLSFLVESSFDAIVGTDLEGRVTSWNEAAERLYGYSAAEALGHDVSRLVTAGELDPQVGWRGDWTSVGEAVELLLGRKIRGKAVLTVS